jgi:predicted phage terminase large subunit-like protein
MRLDRSLSASLANPAKALNELDKLDCEDSLSRFFRLAWSQIEPGVPYVHGWHLDALAEHLEAVTSGQIVRLLINIPPGTMKSLGVGVFWPAWEWGPKGLPHYRIVGASHQIDLQIRDNRRMRQLVKSDWYQAKWPVQLSVDQDAKLKFENTATGFRAAISATGLTGHRGDRVIYDDPHSVEGALSDQQRPAVLRIFQETLTTRMNNPEKSAIVVVMQRLHEDDLSGHILSQELGYDHLCLPMRFEEDRRCVTSIGFEDPRIEDGQLLFPERFPLHVVERDELAMGSMAAAGQFQQRPTPRGGGMFPIDKFQYVERAPAANEIAASIRYWDKAGTDRSARGGSKAAKGGAQTAGTLMHRLHDGRFVIADCHFGQWAALERERQIKLIAETDGKGVKVYVEQEPGSGGKESAEATIRMLAGWNVYADLPTGEKSIRAEPYAAQVQGSNVWLVRGAWNLPFLHEHQAFPVGRTKDMVDASAAAFNLLNVPVATYEVRELIL